MISRNALLTNTDITLLSCLKESIRNSKKIKILAAFIMESGVRLILDDLIYAQNKGAQIQILTGYYLGITEPSALYLLKMNLDASADMRIFKHRNVSFHPKTYIFQDEEQGEIYIGSSNISLSALESGMEWNYKIVKHNEEEDFTEFVDNFNVLFEDHSFKLDDEALKNYSIGWKRNRLFNDNGNVNFNEKYNPSGIGEAAVVYKAVEQIEPYGAQIEALYHLGKTRQEGMDRGLVVMATGVGKTYLAAFDSVSLFCINKIIDKNDMYGYQIIKKLELLSHGVFSFKEILRKLIVYTIILAVVFYLIPIATKGGVNEAVDYLQFLNQNGSQNDIKPDMSTDISFTPSDYTNTSLVGMGKILSQLGIRVTNVSSGKNTMMAIDISSKGEKIATAELINTPEQTVVRIQELSDKFINIPQEQILQSLGVTSGTNINMVSSLNFESKAMKDELKRLVDIVINQLDDVKISNDVFHVKIQCSFCSVMPANTSFQTMCGGESGIRTHGRDQPSHDFQSCLKNVKNVK